MELVHDPALLQGYFERLRSPAPWLEGYPWQLCRYGRKEYLCRFQEPVDRLIFLLEGSVSISLTPPHGRTHIITWAQPETLICGDVEVALGNTLATADLQAAEGGALCLFLPIPPHLDALRQDNAFLRYALARLSFQMASQSIYTANNLLFPLEARMAAYILRYSEGNLFSANLTRTAELLGVSYRQLSRVVHDFQARGLLKKDGTRWRVTGQAGLEALSADIEDI